MMTWHDAFLAGSSTSNPRQTVTRQRVFHCFCSVHAGQNTLRGSALSAYLSIIRQFVLPDC